MDAIKSITVIGLMSGTSLDGVDASIIKTDGVDVFDFGSSINVPYGDELRAKLQKLLNSSVDVVNDLEFINNLEKEFTLFNAKVVEELLLDYDGKIDLIGFSDLTFHHDPKNHISYQLGDGQLLSDLTQIKVVNRFRTADVRLGGQGSPLIPIFYSALTSKMQKPVVVLNIGGISSVSWFGQNGEMLAFDSGVGNGVINDWILKHSGEQIDYNGRFAAMGKVDEQVLSCLMRHKYFDVLPPKSVDVNIFKEKLENLEGLSIEDGAATATAFVAESITSSLKKYVEEMPKEIIITGGGAKNPTLMRMIRQRLSGIEVVSAADVDWDVSALEAQAFAFLATRRLSYMPNSFPTTTGVIEPTIGGEVSDFLKY